MRRNRIRLAAVGAAWLAGFPPLPVSARLEIVPPEQVLAQFVMRGKGGEATLVVDGRSWELVTDPDDPSLSTLGDGLFHPMDPEIVADAVAAIQGSGQLPKGRLLILPFPRRDVLESCTEGSLVFLAPGIRPVHPVHVHSTVVHEVGHIVQRSLCPEGSAAWRDYVALRSLDPVRFHDGAAHRDQPREIFAEDFRVLRGGAVASAAGSLENPDLPPPWAVEGLGAWFARLARRPAAAPFEAVRGSAAPNPFRAAGGGVVAIRFAPCSTAAAGPPLARVLDVAGRHVRTLRAATSDRLEFRWNGTDDHGSRVTTGVYFVFRDADPSGPIRVHILR